MKQGRTKAAKGITTLLLAAGIFWGCGTSTEVPEEQETTLRGPEWVESSHGKVDPDTAKAFPAARRILTLAIPETTWNAMRGHLTDACGPSSECSGSILDGFPDVSAWHAADLYADGQKWASVGFRLPSNGTLADAWEAGADRFPFRITMDKWEKEIPTVDNQRFYGFQKLSLNNLEGDSSGIKHQISGALYRSRGVPAYRSALVSLKLAHGSDTLDLGLYSLREMLDGPMFDRWFAVNDGNLYEPASTLGSFVAGDFSDGDNDGTFTDVMAFVAALNASSRTTQPRVWRDNLGATFDTDGFLNWLAVSTVLGDRGSYGNDAENYALYADGGKLRWMALDLDKTFKGATDSVWHDRDVVGTWPLISNLLADPTFCQAYVSKVRALVAIDGPLSSSKLASAINATASSALAGLPDASTRATKLLDFASQRGAAVNASLDKRTCPSGD